MSPTATQNEEVNSPTPTDKETSPKNDPIATSSQSAVVEPAPAQPASSAHQEEAVPADEKNSAMESKYAAKLFSMLATYPFWRDTDTVTRGFTKNFREDEKDSIIALDPLSEVIFFQRIRQELKVDIPQVIQALDLHTLAEVVRYLEEHEPVAGAEEAATDISQAEAMARAPFIVFKNGVHSRLRRTPARPSAPTPQPKPVASTSTTTSVASAQEKPAAAADPVEMRAALLFPGQGTQHLGMASAAEKYPKAMELFERASKVLGYDLLELCQEGPLSKLNQTEFAQPAIFVCSLAAIERLRVESPDVLDHCVACAGLSLGEFAALVHAGALSFEDGVRLVQKRGQAMEKAASAHGANASGMVSVLGSTAEDIEALLVELNRASHTEDPASPSAGVGAGAGAGAGTGAGADATSTAGAGADATTTAGTGADATSTAGTGAAGAAPAPSQGMVVANRLAPGNTVLAGDLASCARVQEVAVRDFGASKVIPLQVAGAFHSPFMQPALEELGSALNQVELSAPVLPVLANVDALAHTDAESIRQKLCKQLTHPVEWHKTNEYLANMNITHWLEVGPGTVLCGLVRRLHRSDSTSRRGAVVRACSIGSK